MYIKKKGKMIIRQFRDMDADVVADIIKKNLIEVNSKHYPQFVIDHMLEINTPSRLIEIARNRLVLVAVELDEVIGTANFSENYFGSVFVHPDHHGKHVGAKLMESLEDLAKKNGASEVRLHASINAIGFYEKQGYTKGELTSDEKFGTSYEMIKKL